MSERLTALGMGVLVVGFVFLAVHSVGLADELNKGELNKGQSTGSVEASEQVTAAGSPPAPEEKKDACPVARIRAALDRPIAAEFVETPLEDFVAALGKYQIPVFLDRRGLAKMGVDSDTPVTRCVKGVRLAALLDSVLGDLDLTWVIRDDVLLIMHKETAQCMLETRVLDVADLADDEKEIVRLADVIHTVVDPTTWDVVGGPGSIACVDTSEIRALVISQTRGTHEEITRLIADLRSGLAETPAEPCFPASVAAARIEKVLAEKTTLDFVETPLVDVIANLKAKFHIEIQIDRHSLDEMGIAVDSPVTFSLSGVSAESALNLLLRDLDLTFMVKDDVLLVLHEETEQCHLQIKVHPVGDLIDGDPKKLKKLAGLITTSLVPTTWDAVGGPASMVPCHNAGLEVLVVSQTWNVHREIDRLLEALRSVRRHQ